MTQKETQVWVNINPLENVGNKFEESGREVLKESLLIA